MKKEVPIADKALLTLEEMAAFTNVGVNKLKSLTDEQDSPYILWVGNKRLIKKRLFLEYLENQYSI